MNQQPQASSNARAGPPLRPEPPPPLASPTPNPSRSPRASAPPLGTRPYLSRASGEGQPGPVAATLTKQRPRLRRWWWLRGPRRRLPPRGLRDLGRREGSPEAGFCRRGRGRRWRGPRRRWHPRCWRWRRWRGRGDADRCSECGTRPRRPACWAAQSARARAAEPGPCAPACRRRCSPTRGIRTRPRPAAARQTAAAGARCHCPGRARSARQRGLGSEARMRRPATRSLPAPCSRAHLCLCAPVPQHPNTSRTQVCPWRLSFSFIPCLPSSMGLPTLIGPWMALPIATCPHHLKCIRPPNYASVHQNCGTYPSSLPSAPWRNPGSASCR